jgi:hypothetical protein
LQDISPTITKWRALRRLKNIEGGIVSSGKMLITLMRAFYVPLKWVTAFRIQKAGWRLGADERFLRRRNKAHTISIHVWREWYQIKDSSTKSGPITSHGGSTIVPKSLLFLCREQSEIQIKNK